MYTVQPGDTLFSIALRLQVRLNDLIVNNPQIPNPDFIYPGQILTIPSRFCPTLRQGDRGSSVSRLQILLQFFAGYTGKIDGIFGPLTRMAIENWQARIPDLEITGIATTDLWYSLGAECELRPGITRYIIRPGSTLYLIAAWFGVTLESILQINPEITDPNRIFSGQVINIPGNAS